MKALRVGTRGSRLARVQTDIVASILRSKAPEIELDVVLVTTLGDRLPVEKRAEVEGKGAFTEDLEALLQKGKIDIAVHSMKDLPTQLADGLMIGATPVRADPRDALVSKDGFPFAKLPTGAILGTSSIRRKAQLRALRNDIEVVDLHGNVETRLSKMRESKLSGIVIAAAGLERLGEAARITQRFSVDQMVPAPCQGTIALETREGDGDVVGLLHSIDSEATRIESTCERSFAICLGGDCDLPAGFCATVDGPRLKMVGVVLTPDGSEIVRHAATADMFDPASSGKLFAESLLELGGSKILSEIVL